MTFRPNIMPPPAFSRASLTIDCVAEAVRIDAFLVNTVSRRLRRRGGVLGVSGGVDSAVCAGLGARALGSGRVFALLMPEKDSSDDATTRAERLCRQFDIPYVIENITASLEAAGCYARQTEAIRRLIPAYGAGWRYKIVLSNALLERDRIPYFELVAESPDGERVNQRMPAEVYLQVVAATNFKQRIRKNLEYYHAERLNYAVIGTPNRLEYDLGFFVRGGDGLADLKPIAHLYKTQVYAMAAYLDIPAEIRQQPPSTDTYSLPQSQEEFYFTVPYDLADLVLYGMDFAIDPQQVAAATGLEPAQVERIIRDFAAKRHIAARSLHAAYVLESDAA